MGRTTIGALQRMVKEGHKNGQRSAGKRMATCRTGMGRRKNQAQEDSPTILSLKEYEPHKLFWQYLEEVRQLGIKKTKHQQKKKRQAREEREKPEYLKNIQDTIYACKVFKSQGSGETTHLTDANANEVAHCI